MKPGGVEVVGSGDDTFLFFQGGPSTSENLPCKTAIVVCCSNWGTISKGGWFCSHSFEALASQEQLSFPKVIKLMAHSESQKSSKSLSWRFSHPPLLCVSQFQVLNDLLENYPASDLSSSTAFLLLSLWYLKLISKLPSQSHLRIVTFQITWLLILEGKRIGRTRWLMLKFTHHCLHITIEGFLFM